MKGPWGLYKKASLLPEADSLQRGNTHKRAMADKPGLEASAARSTATLAVWQGQGYMTRLVLAQRRAHDFI